MHWHLIPRGGAIFLVFSSYRKRASSRFLSLEKFRLNFSSSSSVIRVNILNPSSILRVVPLWFIIISLVFLYLSKLLFSDFL